MKKTSYYIIAIVVIGVLLVSFWVYQRYIQNDNAEFLTFTVEEGNIQDTVRVRGEVVAQKEFDLSFPFAGIIDKVFVQEGQEVASGDALIKLATIDFSLELERLNATLAQNQASLDKLIAGATREDLNILETKVINAQKTVEDKTLSLKNIQDKADNDLMNDYSDVMDVLNDAYTKTDDALHQQIDALFDNDDTGNPQLTFVVTEIQTEVSAENNRFIAGQKLSDFKAELDNLSSSDYSALDLAMANTKDRLSIIRNFLNILNKAVNSASGISATTVSAYKTNINAGITNINMAVSNISSQEQAVVGQKIINKNNIDVAGEALNTAESALNLAIRNLDLEKAGARSEDIVIAEAQIQEIKSQISITREKIRKSTLYAPGPSMVVKIWLEAGELFSVANTAVSLSTSGYKIQADISELEIGKISEIDGNKVAIELDSFPGQEFDGMVLSVDPREIVKEGDKYYRVNIFLNYSDDRIIRSGMSADLVIDSFFKENVLKVPEFVVYRKDNKRFVKVLENGEQIEVEVEVGISDNESIEVKSGLRKGQIVAVSAD